MKRLRIIIISLIGLLLMVGCSPAQTREYFCEDINYYALLDEEKDILTFKLQSDKKTDREYVFTISENVEAAFYERINKDYPLKEDQYLVSLERIDEDEPSSLLLAITEENYPYFLTPYGSDVIAGSLGSGDSGFFYFVMPCYEKSDVSK